MPISTIPEGTFIAEGDLVDAVGKTSVEETILIAAAEVISDTQNV